MEIIKLMEEEGEKVRRITGLSAQVKNVDRVNVMVDEKYELSLTVKQVVDLRVKVGQEVDEERMEELRRAGEFGKVYQRALEYCLMRPRSEREMRDYLWKKTLDKRTSEGRVRKGVDKGVVEEVLMKLIEAKYVDDEKFARWWVENRMQRKGVSGKRLRMELMKKGVDSGVIEAVMGESERDDRTEMRKVIAKKRAKYTDEELVRYLVGQGFGYYEAKEEVEGGGEHEQD